MHAAEKGHATCVDLLAAREGGMQESDGRTAFMIAVCNGHTDCVKLLLKKEAGMQDEDGRTALMGAADHDHIECIKLLLEKEAGMRDKNGWTALMFATYNNRLGCVRLLAEREGHEDYPQMGWISVWHHGPRHRKEEGPHCNRLHPQWIACSFPHVLSPVTLLVDHFFVSVHRQARRPLPAAPSEDEPHVNRSQRALPDPQEQLARRLAEAPLGTAGGPAQPGSSPRPRPAHVHHLASGWSCRCVLRS